MNESSVRNKDLVIVALGASVIGAAGLLFYQQYLTERKRRLIQEEVEHIGSCVREIRRDLDSVKLVVERSILMMSHQNRQPTEAPSVNTDGSIELFSTLGDNDVYDEFYELSSDNELVVEGGDGLTFEEIDRMLNSGTREDKTKAYGLLLEMLEKGNNNDDVLWRLARACHLMSSAFEAEGSNEKKKEFILKGADFGEKAVMLNDANWRAHKWFAICVGERGQLMSVRDKLKDGNLFKEHVDKAIAINPEDATLHHLLGRFYYEIATLSWLERKVANTLFGKVPEGSYKDAINSLLKAEELHAIPWKSNRLLLAKCHAALQDHKETLHWLDLAKEAPVNNDEDQIAQKELEELLTKFNPYRSLKT